jgi:conjugal transfer pilus assembly protein TraF
MKLMMKYFLMGLLWVSQSVFCDTYTYFDDHEKGWHWYQQEPVKQDSAPEPVADPTEEMSAVRALIKKSLNQAILNPTQKNVQEYISLQNQMSDRSSQFSNVWQKVLLNNPDLNYSLIHPTNSIGSQVDTDTQHVKEDQAIAQLAKQTGLFFFYHSTCPYCQRFAPILKNFSDHYGITVIPITTDGISLPEFPNSKANAGQAEKFNVTVEPALFAVNPYTHKAYPVSYGLLTEDDLRKRILDLTTKFATGDE